MHLVVTLRDVLFFLSGALVVIILGTVVYFLRELFNKAKELIFK